MDDAVRVGCRVIADHSHHWIEAVLDQPLGVEPVGDGYAGCRKVTQRLCCRTDDGAGAEDCNRALGCIDQPGRRGNVFGIGHGAIGGCSPMPCFRDDRLRHLAPFNQLGGEPGKVEVHGQRRRRARFAHRLAKQKRQLRSGFNTRGEPCNRRKERPVIDFLIGIAVELGDGLVTRHREHRRTSQVGVLQPGREIRCAHGLRHADADAASGTGVTVGHVRRRLLAVGHDAGHPERFEFDQGVSPDRLHEEHVSDAVFDE